MTDVVACVALALSKDRGVELRSEEGPRSVVFSQVMRTAGIASVVNVVEVHDRGSERAIETRRIRDRPDQPRELPPVLSACL
jgi:hypothetical protein